MGGYAFISRSIHLHISYLYLSNQSFFYIVLAISIHHFFHLSTLEFIQYPLILIITQLSIHYLLISLLAVFHCCLFVYLLVYSPIYPVIHSLIHFPSFPHSYIHFSQSFFHNAIHFDSSILFTHSFIQTSSVTFNIFAVRPTRSIPIFFQHCIVGLNFCDPEEASFFHHAISKTTASFKRKNAGDVALPLMLSSYISNCIQLHRLSHSSHHHDGSLLLPS